MTINPLPFYLKKKSISTSPYNKYKQSETLKCILLYIDAVFIIYYFIYSLFSKTLDFLYQSYSKPEFPGRQS